MTLSDELIRSVKQHEGYRETAYKDSVGVWTVGYGTNLQTLTISEGTAELWLQNELIKCANFVDTLPQAAGITSNRRDVLIEMAYNIGLSGLQRFKKMLEAVADSDYERAEAEMLDSKWASQVGQRANRLGEKMRTG